MKGVTIVMKKVKNFWLNLSSRTKKIIKTFFEAGIAYIITYVGSNAIGLDKESIKVLIVSALSAGISAVLNITDKG